MAAMLPLIVAAAAAALSQAEPSPAPGSPNKDDEIVIEGRREDAVRAFVRSLDRSGPTEQLGRWKQTVCPAVAGIAPSEAAWMEERIVAVASAVDLKRQARCMPNLIVIVTDEPEATAHRIAKIFPRDDGQLAIRKFERSDAPVRWLTVTDPCGDGCSLANSRIEQSTRPTFSGLLILVDGRRVGGFSLLELADYVALVGLSNPAQGHRHPASSILSMFDRPRDGGRYAITAEDEAFLIALYHSNMGNRSASQQSAIANEMKRRLAKPPEEPERR